ncbi:unnamed protein product [Diamesa serratosioi]
MNDICRICLEQKQNYFLIPISVKIEEGTIIELISYCSSITINADDHEYPKNICHECLQQLKVGCNIKRKCLESNEKLSSLHTKIKIENKVEFVEIEEIHDEVSLDIWKNELSDGSNRDFDSAIDDTVLNQPEPKKVLRKGGRQAQPRPINLPLVYSNAYDKPSFICDFCGIVIKNKSKLILHFRKEHKTKKRIYCKLCNLDFRFTFALRVHNRYHSGERQFKCDLCPKQFILNCELTRHKKNHDVINMDLCNFCGKIFSYHYLKKHKIKCAKNAMKHPEQLEIAKLALLDLQIEYTCDLCSLKVKGKSFLKTHMRRTHLKKQGTSSQKVFYCNFDNCNKKFQQRYNLVIHKRLHINKTNFPCDKCPRTFMREFMLNKHQNSPACPGNAVNCLTCHKTFRSKKLLENHQSRVHDVKEKKDPKPKTSTEFFCEFCGKRVCSRYALHNHLLVNHKDESFKEFRVSKCSFCIKEFVYRHDLRIHELYHTKTKPFKCDFPGCTKAFVQNSKVNVN